MKFHINKQELLQTLELAQETTERDNSSSYFSFIIFEVEHNVLIVKSANRLTTFEQKIEKTESNKLVIDEPGGYLLPGSKILNIVKNLDNGIIDFSTDGMDLVVTENRKSQSTIEFKIRMRELEDYPRDIHTADEENYVYVLREDINKIISDASIAVLSESRDVSIFLSGIFFDVGTDKITAVATDRKRMSVSYIEVDEAIIQELQITGEQDIIVPMRSISFLLRLLYKFDALEEIGMMIEQEKIFFKLGNIKISSNLISGKYYDYNLILPKEEKNTIVVNTNNLKKSIVRVSSITEFKNDSKLSLNINTNNIEISIEEEKGYAKETISAEVDGNNYILTLKTQFILDSLKTITTENTRIAYGEEERDLVVITSEPKDNSQHIMNQLR